MKWIISGRTLTARIHTSSSSEIQEFVNMDQWSDDQPCVCSSCSASLRPLTRQIPEWTRSSLAQQLQSQLKLLQFIWRPSVVIFILLLESPGYAWNAVQPDKWDEISAKIALFSGPALKRVRLRTDRSIWRWYQRKAICHNEPLRPFLWPLVAPDAQNDCGWNTAGDFLAITLRRPLLSGNQPANRDAILQQIFSVGSAWRAKQSVCDCVRRPRVGDKCTAAPLLTLWTDVICSPLKLQRGKIYFCFVAEKMRCWSRLVFLFSCKHWRSVYC